MANATALRTYAITLRSFGYYIPSILWSNSQVASKKIGPPILVNRADWSALTHWSALFRSAGPGCPVC